MEHKRDYKIKTIFSFQGIFKIFPFPSMQCSGKSITSLHAVISTVKFIILLEVDVMSNILEKNDMTSSFRWPLHEFPDFKLLYTLESVWRLSHPNLIKANKSQSGVLPFNLRKTENLYCCLIMFLIGVLKHR